MRRLEQDDKELNAIYEEEKEAYEAENYVPNLYP